jgi:hypothetical protein
LRMSIPRNILSRASTENLTSLADILLLREICFDDWNAQAAFFLANVS